MYENLTIALKITILGMGLVFLGIIILWLLMLALTASTPWKKEIEKTGLGDPELEQSLKAKAAAIAVAFVMADQRQPGVNRFPLPPTALVSAWQLTTRTRQLNHEGRPR